MDLKLIILLLFAGYAATAENDYTMPRNTAHYNNKQIQNVPTTRNSIKNRQYQGQNSTNDYTMKSSSNPFYEFNKKLFKILGPLLLQYNVVYSPFSLQCLLGFIYTGAEAETAQELRKAIDIPEMPGEVARLFQASLQHVRRQTSQDMKLKMANILYYNDYFTLNEDFYRSSIPYFEAIVQSINFDSPSESADRINHMVEDMTEQRIRDLISADTLTPETQAVLLNAIYLQAKWATEFSVLDTQMEEFRVAKGRTVPVNMMYLDAEFKVGEFPNLKAKAIELPFKNSNLSMLIILPNDIDGLMDLEFELGNLNLNQLIKSLRRTQIILRMPKFKFEFEVDMTPIIIKLGASRIFTNNAQIDGIFRNQRVKVDRIQHKAYINVNEGGVEAAASSYGKLLPLSVPVQANHFKIDQPFVFVIRSPEAVYFIGHVVQPLM